MRKRFLISGMFCPMCKSEYREGFSRCIECNVALVAKPPEKISEYESNNIKERLVTVASFINMVDAHMARSRIESTGIKCFLADENTVAINWLYSQAVGGIKIQVNETDAEKAKEVLNEKPVSADTSAGPKEVSANLCPKCNSHNVYYMRLWKRPIFFSWLIIGIPLPFFKRRWVCKDCGHEWKK